MPLDALPHDVIYTIFEAAASQEPADLSRLSRTCKSLHAVYTDHEGTFLKAALTRLTKEHGSDYNAVLRTAYYEHFSEQYAEGGFSALVGLMVDSAKLDLTVEEREEMKVKMGVLRNEPELQHEEDGYEKNGFSAFSELVVEFGNAELSVKEREEMKLKMEMGPFSNEPALQCDEEAWEKVLGTVEALLNAGCGRDERLPELGKDIHGVAERFKGADVGDLIFQKFFQIASRKPGASTLRIALNNYWKLNLFARYMRALEVLGQLQPHCTLHRDTGVLECDVSGWLNAMIRYAAYGGSFIAIGKNLKHNYSSVLVTIIHTIGDAIWEQLLTYRRMNPPALNVNFADDSKLLDEKLLQSGNWKMALWLMGAGSLKQVEAWEAIINSEWKGLETRKMLNRKYKVWRDWMQERDGIGFKRFTRWKMMGLPSRGFGY